MYVKYDARISAPNDSGREGGGGGFWNGAKAT